MQSSFHRQLPLRPEARLLEVQIVLVRRECGAVAAVVAALLSRNPWLPFIAGMAVLFGLRAVLGA